MTRADRQRCRHRPGKLLLRRGLHYPGRACTQAHRRWVNGLTWSHPADRVVVDDYLLAIDGLEPVAAAGGRQYGGVVDDPVDRGRHRVLVGRHADALRHMGLAHRQRPGDCRSPRGAWTCTTAPSPRSPPAARRAAKTCETQIHTRTSRCRPATTGCIARLRSIVSCTHGTSIGAGRRLRARGEPEGERRPNIHRIAIAYGMGS